MNYFQSRKGAHLLSIYLKPTDRATTPDGKGSTTPRSNSARRRHWFAHSKQTSYDPMRRGHDHSTDLGAF